MTAARPMPTVLPRGWVETTLGEAFKWGSGGTPLTSNSSYYGGDIPWVTISDLVDGPVRETRSTITPEGMENSSAKWVEPGSVLIAIYGSIGKLGIAKRRLTTNQAIAFTNPLPIPSEYLFWWLRSQRDYLNSIGKGGTQSNISQHVLKQLPFRIAPLAEQGRIVEAIETLFARLDKAVQVLKSIAGDDIPSDGGRIGQLRRSVLRAAFEGRLVPQDPNDEPASALLERIRSANQASSKSARHGQKPLASG